MKENLDDVLNAHSDVVRVERLTHHIARIHEGLNAVQSGQRSIPTEEELIAELEALK